MAAEAQNEPRANEPPLFEVDAGSSAFDETLRRTPRARCVIPQCRTANNGHSMSRCPTRKMVSNYTYYRPNGRLDRSDHWVRRRGPRGRLRAAD